MVGIIDFFDHRKTFVTRTRPRDAEQLKEAFANLGFDLLKLINNSSSDKPVRRRQFGQVRVV